MGVSHSMNMRQVDQVLSQFEATTLAIQGIEKKVDRFNGYIKSMQRQRTIFTEQADAATDLVDNISDSLNQRFDDVLEAFQSTLDSLAGPVEQLEVSILGMGLQHVPATLHKEFGPMLVPAAVLVIIVTSSNSMFGFMLAADTRLQGVMSLSAGLDPEASSGNAFTDINILNVFAIFHVALLSLAALFLVVESCRKASRRRRLRRAKGETASLWDSAKDFNFLEKEEDEPEESPLTLRLGTQRSMRTLTAGRSGLSGISDSPSSASRRLRSSTSDGSREGVPASASTSLRIAVGAQVVAAGGRGVFACDAAGVRRRFHLPAGESATVVELDEFGDLRLRSPAGLESGWVQREQFVPAQVVATSPLLSDAEPSIGQGPGDAIAFAVAEAAGVVQHAEAEPAQPSAKAKPKPKLGLPAAAAAAASEGTPSPGDEAFEDRPSAKAKRHGAGDSSRSGVSTPSPGRSSAGGATPAARLMSLLSPSGRSSASTPPAAADASPLPVSMLLRRLQEVSRLPDRQRLPALGKNRGQRERDSSAERRERQLRRVNSREQDLGRFGRYSEDPGPSDPAAGGAGVGIR